jgi:hypothetical protein
MGYLRSERECLSEAAPTEAGTTQTPSDGSALLVVVLDPFSSRGVFAPEWITPSGP